MLHVQSLQKLIFGGTWISNLSFYKLRAIKASIATYGSHIRSLEICVETGERLRISNLLRPHYVWDLSTQLSIYTHTYKEKDMLTKTFWQTLTKCMGGKIQTNHCKLRSTTLHCGLQFAMGTCILQPMHFVSVIRNHGSQFTMFGLYSPTHALCTCYKNFFVGLFAFGHCT